MTRGIDREFLEEIFQDYCDAPYICLLSDDSDLHDATLKKVFAEAVDRDWAKSHEFDKLKRVLRGSFDFRKSFQGSYIQGIRSDTLDLVEEDRARLQDIPVVLAPTRDLNATAIPTPAGGVVIALNHGLFSCIGMVMQSALAYVTWDDDKPFCRDASRENYAKLLIALARYIPSNDFRHFTLDHMAALRFPSIPKLDRRTNLTTMLVQHFLLLHEYGHVVLGHLDDRLLRPAFATRDSPLREYSKSQLQEFEADQYAVEYLMRACAAVEGPPTFVAVVLGYVMKFQEVCEFLQDQHPAPASRTHPPARDRWMRIKEMTGIGPPPSVCFGGEGQDPSTAFVWKLDQAFESLMLGREPRR